MRKIIWILIFVLVLSSVSATDYSKYREVNLVYSINSNLATNIIGSDPRILEAEAVVKLFPRKNFESQRLTSFDIDSEPDAETDMNEVLRFYWKNLLTDRLYYNLDARIATTNNFIKVNRKINYPHAFDDSGVKKYLKATEFIDVNEDIRNTARNIVGDEDDYFIVVTKVADWVKRSINYDLNSLTEQAVQKSSWVLENKQGVCDEITNLFVSMLRSLGIPARFVSGTAYTNLEDDWGNHGWAEVYFPGFGWVSYDVTYGQYGWVDPSHLKLSHTYDSGESSVDYKWRVRGLNLQVDELDIKTQFGSFGVGAQKKVSLDVRPMHKEAGFGSFVLLEVVVTNMKNYYVSELISLVKAPKMLSPVSKIVWLRPNEVKTLYWIVEIPENLDPKFVFSAGLVVEGSFGESAKSSILISKNAKHYTYGEAVKREGELDQRDLKKDFEDLDLDCSSGKSEYYSNEEIDVGCEVVNNGVKDLDLKICLDSDCDEFSLNVGESKSLDFVSVGSGKKTVVIESDDFIGYHGVDVQVIAVPDIYISDLSPKKVGYKELVNLSFVLNSEFRAFDAKIDIDGFGVLDLRDFIGEQTISMEVYGKDLVKGLNLRMSYKDVKGKEYVKDEVYYVDVLDVPLLRRVLLFFGI